MRSSLALAATVIGIQGAVGCSTARPAPVSPPPAPAAASERTTDTTSQVEDRVTSSEKIPDACSPGSDVCVPPTTFAKKLCDGTYPDVALAMFAKGTPWTRAYVSREVEAWNAAGGRAASAKLQLGEEVILLVARESKGGVQVGAGGNYDVLRWDGSCASLMSDEVTRKTPLKPKYATIKWRSLDNKVREALLADPTIEKTDVERRRECKTSLGTEPSPSCAKADARLSMLVVDRILKGAALPLPGELR